MIKHGAGELRTILIDHTNVLENNNNNNQNRKQDEYFRFFFEGRYRRYRSRLWSSPCNAEALLSLYSFLVLYDWVSEGTPHIGPSS